MRTKLYVGILGVAAVAAVFILAQSDTSSVRSLPPDVIQYSRSTIPADKIRFSLQPQALFATPTLVDST